MNNIFTDIRTAVNLTRDIRRARRDGYQVGIHRFREVAAFNPGYWGFTIEFPLLVHDREAAKAVKAVFLSLPASVQHDLTMSPEKPGEAMERARFWRRQLAPALPPKMYHAVMVKFVRWYAYCLRIIKGAQYNDC